jgi:hypothetical protein
MTTLKLEVIQKYLNPYFVETGTADGDCVSLVSNLGFEKIYSIELDTRLQESNIKKFSNLIEEGKLELIIGDSLLELSNIISKLDRPTTFWLDAHVDDGPMGIKKCPLYEELNSINSSPIKTHTIMIDDMRCLGGGNWGHGISMQGLQERLLQINPEYKFTLENGWAPNDILVAYV